MKIDNELKLAREEKKLSLNDVFKKTKIPIAKLKALEAENYEYFTSKFYAKRFLKTYSEFLGLNIYPDEIINSGASEPLNIPSYLKNDKEIDKKHILKILSNIVGVIILIGVALYFIIYLIELRSVALDIPKEAIQIEQIAFESSNINIKGITVYPTWVRVKADGKIIEDGILSAPATYYWESLKLLEMRIGYVWGIEIYNRIGTEYKKVDIIKGNVGGINEIQFLIGELDEFSK